MQEDSTDMSRPERVLTVYRRLACLLLTVALLAGMPMLTGCAPKDRAVGDSWHEGTVPHDGVDRSDTLVALIGCPKKGDKDPDAGLDSRILSSLQAERMKGYFSSAQSTSDQQDGVQDAINRGASLILIRQPGAGDWTPALKAARKAGIPVVEFAQSGKAWTPDPGRLYYAATVHPVDPAGNPHAPLLADALQTIVDDGPHARIMAVRFSADREGTEDEHRQ